MTADVSTRLSIPLVAADRSDRAAAAVLQGLWRVFEANLQGAQAGSDPEALHDLRVSVRRSRSVQREFKHVFPPEELRAFRQGFRWLQRVTGAARDLDVQVGELTALAADIPPSLHPDLERLVQRLETRRQATRADMAAALCSERAVSLMADWRRFLDGLSGPSPSDRPDGQRPIGQLAGRRIRRAYRRMVERGRRIGPGSPSEPYHALRKQGKELRYLLELFGTPLYPQEVVKPMIRSLKDLQDVLGRHQDRETQIDTLNRLSGSEALPVDPRLTQLVVERLVADKLAARRAFGPRFGAFAQPEQADMV
ncbi:MAG TPA: CHAD domain-containing protein, partial [Solirubrobacteraceae bacterium]|nr:CHAD domain-containing protein [Solirubrobacteraceae bacterium]